MADSSTVNVKTTILPCDICEVEKALKWHCFDCSISMCQKCKEKIHPKFKLAETHKVTEISNEELAYDETKEEVLEFSTIPCLEHSGQLGCLYCDACDKVICGLCVKSQHKTHKFEEIDEKYKTRKEQVRKRMTELKEGKNMLLQEIKKLENNKADMKKRFTKTEDRVTNHEHIVKTLTESMKTRFEKKWSEIEKAFDEEIKKITKRFEDIDLSLTKVDEIVQAKDVHKFFHDSGDLKELVTFTESSELCHLDVQIAAFDPEVISQEYFSRLMDKREVILQQHHETSVENSSDFIEVIKTKSTTESSAQYATDSNKGIELAERCSDERGTQTDNAKTKNNSSQYVPVDAIECKMTQINSYQIDIAVDGIELNTDGMWIRSGGDVTKVEVRTGKVEGLVAMASDVKCMTSSPRGGLILCIDNETRLQHLNTRSGRMSSLRLNTGELQPVAACIHGKLTYVAAVNMDYPEHGRRAIFKINQNGKYLFTFERTTPNRPVFVNPYSLVTANNGVIYLLEKMSPYLADTDRVVVLNENLGPKFIYYAGHTAINSWEEPFIVSCIETTPSSYAIISDIGSKTLHIINENTELLAYVNTEYTVSAIKWITGASFFLGTYEKTVESIFDDDTTVKGHIYEMIVTDFKI